MSTTLEEENADLRRQLADMKALNTLSYNSLLSESDELRADLRAAREQAADSERERESEWNRAEHLEFELADLGHTLQAIMEETVMAGLPAGDREQTLANVRELRRQLAEARALQIAIESNGHYCDGMAAAWSDAQAALGRAAQAEADLQAVREQAKALAEALIRKHDGPRGPWCECLICRRRWMKQGTPHHEPACPVAAYDKAVQA